MENELDDRGNILNVCSITLLGIGILNFFYPQWEWIYSFGLIYLLSFGYMVYYLVKTDKIKGIVGNLILTFVIMGVCAAPPLALILGLFILYNVITSLQNVRGMLRDALLSLIIFIPLILSDLFSIPKTVSFIMFVIGWLIFSNKLAKETNKNYLNIRYSMALISVPLIAITIASIFSSLKNILNVTHTTAIQKRSMPTEVSSYVRQDGTFVSSHIRNQVRNVPITTTQITAGSGAMTSSVTRELSDVERLDIQRIDNNQAIGLDSLTNSSTFYTSKSISDDVNVQTAYQTNAESHISETNSKKNVDWLLISAISLLFGFIVYANFYDAPKSIESAYDVIDNKVTASEHTTLPNDVNETNSSVSDNNIQASEAMALVPVAEEQTQKTVPLSSEYETNSDNANEISINAEAIEFLVVV
ncbi:hypothetical protein MOTT16_03110 [Moraxella osloensis]|uniref:Uncharacterized protein n=1 Tax=Faucicola osloensis TaxID=34062 RepID=A0AAD0ADJ6_FAUOS|nr:hypothetical protein [Moraxella osloensis]ATQ82897.1 hypothetical protein YHS_03115 [Moraxella osloensis]ATW85397.1 hypothetical protein MOTT16_03110 [Moraxella osloensis]